MQEETRPTNERPDVAQNNASAEAEAETPPKETARPQGQGLAIVGGIAGYFIADAAVPSRGIIEGFVVGFLGAGGGVCALTVIVWLFGYRGSPTDPARVRKVLWVMALFTVVAVAGLWLMAVHGSEGAYLDKATSLAEAGKYKEACEVFEKAAKSNPMDPTVYLKWGLTLGHMGRHAWACEKFAVAVKIDPQDAQVYRNWGIALGSLERHAEAAEKFAMAVQIEPDNAKSQGHWGTALALSGNIAEAEKRWKRAEELEPSLKPHIEDMRKHIQAATKGHLSPTHPPGGGR